MRTPNFFLAGTTKGGTSTLYLWLAQHPDISLPTRKELHYFCGCPTKLKSASHWDEYVSLFGHGQEPVIGEASPCYIYYPNLPEALREQIPEARILFSLRDPVERFWSHYLMNRTYRRDYLSPTEIIRAWEERPPTIATDDLVGMGMYGAQYDKWLQAFHETALHVVFLEELTADPGNLLKGVFEFLRVGPHEIDTTVRDKTYVEGRNPVAHYLLSNRMARKIGVALLGGRVRRFVKYRVLGRSDLRPVIPERVAATLQDLYREDSLHFERLLNRPLPWTWHHTASP